MGDIVSLYLLFANLHTKLKTHTLTHLQYPNNSSSFTNHAYHKLNTVELQAIAGLRDIHKVGYIHRDVKPANMCFGLTQKVRNSIPK